MTTTIDLGKLRFYWAGAYANNSEYELNDVVRYGGNVYVYINVVRTVGNEPTDELYWALMVEGINFVGEWSTATQYFIGDAIAYGSTVYVALEDNIAVQPDQAPTIWSQFVEGIQFEGEYSPATTYQKNDVVSFGPSAFIAKTTTNNNDPTNTTFWDSFVTGISPEGVYNSGTSYVAGDLVAYGANLYVAKGNTVGNVPTDVTYWDLFVDGIRTRGNWATTTEYFINDIVVYGGNTYICIVQNVSGVFATDLANAKWQVFNSGIRWRNTWTANTYYLTNDVVRNVGSSYIAAEDFTSGANFSVEFDAGKWQFFAQGADDVLPPIAPGLEGYSLTVGADGATLDWVNTTGTAKVYYVSPDGVEGNPGTSLALPFGSIKAACNAATAAGGGATIFVKTGTYAQTELPIVVPVGTVLVGDNQRTVIVQPGAGLAADGVTPNNEATMFLMSNASGLTQMSFTGMTGWVPGSTPENLSTATPKGVVVALNPASPVTTKSPYITDCSAIGSGCVGALVDGATQASGNRSILFHAYTVISDNGVGFWVKDGGRAEMVSCFTYFAYFGYGTTGGGIIRSLNGNNSYGTWGVASSGFLASETTTSGAIFGKQLTVTADPIPAGFTAGSAITGVTSGATGTVTDLQASAGKIYYEQTSAADFVNGEDVTDGVETLTITGDGVSNQNGFLLVANGFSTPPLPGASIQIAGDSSAYVVRAVSGTYVDTSSVLSIALVQEKVVTSAPGAAITVRYNYSQIRLTGHDFLSIGTGGIASTNYPGLPPAPIPGNEVDEHLPGRVYYVTTDQDGNFRVGEYFRIDQGTGTATLNANAFDLSGLTSLKLGSIGAQLGEQINEFSSDVTLGGNNPTNLAVPTEFAVKTYVDTQLANVGAVWASKTADYTAASNDYLFCDTSAGSFTITLPANPAPSTAVAIADVASSFASFNLFVGRNGAKIMGFDEDLVLDVQNASIVLTYSGATYGWRIT